MSKKEKISSEQVVQSSPVNNLKPKSKAETVEITLPENMSAYLTPIFILLGSILIAAAIFISSGKNSSTNTTGTGASNTNTGTTAAVDANAPTDYNKIFDFAAQNGVDKAKLTACYNNNDTADTVKNDITAGKEAGVTGTPGFIIGTLSADGTVTGIRIDGAYPYDSFKAAFEKYLNGTDNAALAEFKEASTKLTDAPRLGNKDAKVAIVEYSDFECPFCKRHATDVSPQILTDYINTNKVIWAYRNFPLDFHDPVATQEARIASCVKTIAGDEAFFKVHNFIFTNTRANGKGV